MSRTRCAGLWKIEVELSLGYYAPVTQPLHMRLWRRVEPRQTGFWHLGKCGAEPLAGRSFLLLHLSRFWHHDVAAASTFMSPCRECDGPLSMNPRDLTELGMPDAATWVRGSCSKVCVMKHPLVGWRRKYVDCTDK